MNKPKILIFSLTYLPFIGGAEVAIQEITKRLSGEFEFSDYGEESSGWDLITHNLNGKQKSQEQIGNLRIFRVGKGKLSKYFYPWLAFKKARKLHKENNYKITWGMMATWGGWAALKFKERFSEVKYLLTLQSGDTDEFINKRTWFWKWRYKKIYQKADRIQVISTWLGDRTRKFGYKGEIDIVPNGTSQKHKNIKTQKHPNQKIILTVSRLVEKNGIEDLVRAFKLLITNYQLPITLKIIGEGRLKNKLQKLTNELNLQDRVKFLGKIKYKDLQQYYAQADVFCRPSLSEGFGNVFIEAMAANVPVIGTPIGGILDFLKDNQTGWFCKVQNPKSIAEKIKYILDEKNKDKVASVVANAKEMVEYKYTWDKVAEQMKVVFNSLIHLSS